jgi:hypothetical protein
MNKEISMDIPDGEALPHLPVLGPILLGLIGEYGLARTDGVSETERIHRWTLLIDGIKVYASSYGAACARAVLAAPQNTQDHLAVPPVEAPAFSWHCTSEDDYPTGQVSTSPLGNGDVALTFGNDAKANARFIANAPRVYAALQALVTGLAANDEEGLIEHAEVMQEARSALAAAPKE